MAPYNLSNGICTLYQTADQGDPEVFAKEHILQVLSVKKVDPKNPAASDRYRLIISDGIHFIQAMLATQHNNLVTSKAIDKNVVVAVDKCSCNIVQGKRLVFELHLSFKRCIFTTFLV
jgi:replication factor A1